MSTAEVKRVQQRFDDMYHEGITPWTEHELELPIRQLPQRLLAENPEPTLLDIGCGNGWISLYLASQGIKVQGIDSSPVAIAEAIEKAVEAQLGEQTTFEVGDGLALPYDFACFDAVLDRGFFHHVPKDEYERYLTEVSRVLKRGGVLSLHAFTPRNKGRLNHEFSSDDIVRIFGHRFGLLAHSEDPWPTRAPAYLGHYLLRKKK